MIKFTFSVPDRVDDDTITAWQYLSTLKYDSRESAEVANANDFSYSNLIHDEHDIDVMDRFRGEFARLQSCTKFFFQGTESFPSVMRRATRLLLSGEQRHEVEGDAAGVFFHRSISCTYI